MDKLLIFLLFIFSITGHAKCFDCSTNKNLKVYSKSSLIKSEVAMKVVDVVMQALNGERVITDYTCKNLNVSIEKNRVTFTNGNERSYIILEESILDGKEYVSSMCLKNEVKKVTTVSCVTRTKDAFENMNQDEQLSFYISYGKIDKQGEGAIDALIKCPTP